MPKATRRVVFGTQTVITRAEQRPALQVRSSKPAGRALVSYRVDVDVGWFECGPDGSVIGEVELCDGIGRDLGDERDRSLDADAGSVAGWVEFGRSPGPGVSQTAIGSESIQRHRACCRTSGVITGVSPSEPLPGACVIRRSGSERGVRSAHAEFTGPAPRRQVAPAGGVRQLGARR